MQRYVSKELTHFVGTSLKEGRTYEAKQYDLLAAILRSGALKPRPDFPDSLLVISLKDDKEPLSGNQAYWPYCVCFCDIPEGDFSLHIRKYSHFGLGFKKSFLVHQGANPVFYIARNALVIPSAFSDPPPKGRQISLADEFDSFGKAFRKIRGSDEGSDSFKRWLTQVCSRLDYNVLAFLKFFDDTLSEDAAKNYYMERECAHYAQCGQS